MKLNIQAYFSRSRLNSKSLVRFKTAVRLFFSLFSMQSVFAVPQRGSFQMAEIPDSISFMKAFPDGTATGSGSSAANSSVQVIRHFDGQARIEESMRFRVAFWRAGS